MIASTIKSIIRPIILPGLNVHPVPAPAATSFMVTADGQPILNANGQSMLP